MNRKTSQLQEEHNALLISFYDKYPQTRMGDAITPLTKKFKNFSLKTSSVQVLLKNECNLSFKRITRCFEARNNQLKLVNRKAWIEEMNKTDVKFLNNCGSIDESGFGINMRPFGGLSEKGTPAIITTPSTRAASYPILGAINVKFVMTLESRNPQTFKRIEIDDVGLKRKAPIN